MQSHLLYDGVMQTYTSCHDQGELHEAHHHETASNEDVDLGGIDDLVEDRIRGELHDTTQMEEARDFNKLLTDAKCELYWGCTAYAVEIC